MLSVLIVAGDPLVRTALARALGEADGLHVVGRSAPGAELSEAVERLRPDVVLLDVGLGPAMTLDVPTRMEAPSVWLIPEREGTRAALQAGARAVLRRDAEPAVLEQALRSAACGLVVLDPAFLSEVLGEAAPATQPGAELTAREREVLEQLARGRSNKEIATALEISEHTAKFHVNSLLSKLGAQSRTEVVVRAARRGWLSL